MSNPTNRSYTAEHEWVLVEGDVATIGITAYAAEKLGDVVFVDLPKVGTSTTYMKICGEIESTKSVGELYAPLDGEVVEINDVVVSAPETVNTDPFGAGWLIKVKFASLPELMTAEQYDVLTGEG
jgi:glycine cleavage system H protein